MKKASIIGLDLAKRSFQAQGTLADGRVAFRKKRSIILALIALSVDLLQTGRIEERFDEV